MRSGDLEAAADDLVGYFESAPGGVDTLLGLLGGELGSEDTEIVGLLLQVALELSDMGPELIEPWTRDLLAEHLIEGVDLGPVSSRIVQIALLGFGDRVRPQLMVRLLEQNSRPDLVHNTMESARARAFLIEQWAKVMSNEVEPLLYDAFGKWEGRLQTSAADVLLRRDWRAFAGVLSDEFEMVHAGGDSFELFERDIMLEVLGGRFLNLEGRDKLELLREHVDTPAVTKMALMNLDPAEAAELARWASEDDRAWDGYRWIELGTGSPRAIDAGFALLDEYRDSEDRFAAPKILSRMLQVDPQHPRVTAELNARFAQRAEWQDPFWASIENLARDTSVERLHEVALPWMERTKGEGHPRRDRLREMLLARYPDLRSWI